MHSARPEIPETMIAKWQRVVDLAAKLTDVPVSLVMKTDPPDHSVFVASRTDSNPYQTGQSFVLNSKLYCYDVLQRCEELLVRDAYADPRWSDNQDLEFGMSFYLGYPLGWPDGTLFGTICVLDRRDNEKALALRELLQEFKHIIEGDLALLCEIARRKALERALHATLGDLDRRVRNRTDELKEANTALKVLLARLEEARLDLERSILHQVRTLVLPQVAKLRSHVTGSEAGRAYLDLLEANLHGITSNFPAQAATELEKLTPTEIDIAQMIMHGQKTKEIAKALSRETSTIDFHRNNIRRKLGIDRRRINLRSYLRSIYKHGGSPPNPP